VIKTDYIISKIENTEGIAKMDEIIKVSDGIMVARGDMGTEIPLEQIPAVQKQMIKQTVQKGKYVIVATEMLESMIQKRRPTRAETTDVANAIYDGTSATMLSGESASGKYPIEAVKTMAQIALASEKAISYDKRFTKNNITTEKLQTTGTPYWAKTESWGVSFGKNSTPFAYIHEGSGMTGFELRGYGSPCFTMNGDTGSIVAQNGMSELNISESSKLNLSGSAQMALSDSSTPISMQVGSTLFQIAKNVRVTVDDNGELEVRCSDGRPALRIGADKDTSGFHILCGSALLEAKADGLYYNGEKL